jgi:hypothetical protein
MCILHIAYLKCIFNFFFSKSTYFSISEIINVYFIIYRLFEQKGLALSESLNIFSKNLECFECDQNEVFQRNKSFSAVKKCRPLPILEICKVFNGESVNDQCIEHLTLTDSFKIKYAPRNFTWCWQEFSQNGQKFLFQNLTQHTVIKCDTVS